MCVCVCTYIRLDRAVSARSLASILKPKPKAFHSTCATRCYQYELTSYGYTASGLT